MKWTTAAIAFVAALVLGASFTAAIRGANLDKPEPPAADDAAKEATPEPVDPHAGHRTGDKKTETETSRETVDPHAGHDMGDKKPEIATDPKRVGDVIDLNNAVCPIMGGTSSDKVYVDHQGIRVHFCCPGCEGDFLKEADKHFKRMGVDDVDAFKKRFPPAKKADEPKKDDKPKNEIDPVRSGDVIDLQNTHCPIMGGPANAKVFVDYQGIRVRFCCPGCDDDFLEEPKKYLSAMGVKDLDAFKKRYPKGK